MGLMKVSLENVVLQIRQFLVERKGKERKAIREKPNRRGIQQHSSKEMIKWMILFLISFCMQLVEYDESDLEMTRKGTQK